MPISTYASKQIGDQGRELGPIDQIAVAHKSGDGALSVAVPQFQSAIPAGREQGVVVPLLAPVQAVDLVLVLLQADQRLLGRLLVGRRFAVQSAPDLERPISGGGGRDVGGIGTPGDVKQSIGPLQTAQLPEVLAVGRGCVGVLFEQKERTTSSKTVQLAGNWMVNGIMLIYGLVQWVKRGLTL